MAYAVTVNLGAGWEDISAKLMGRYPVTRTRANHAPDDPFKPVIGTARFAINRDVTLINRFLTASSAIGVTILKDGAAYFSGQVRNTHKVRVGILRAEAFEIECVDAWMRLEKKSSLSATWSGYTISNPSTKAASILHQLFYAAGFADGELNLAAVAVIRDRAVFDATKGKTYREIIEEILAEIGFSAYVDASGVVRLYDSGPTSITPSATLSSGIGGNIAAGYEIERLEAKSEAMDVTYWPHLSLSGKTVFEDTTGADGSHPSCNIPLTAGQYYPNGADATHDVRGEFKLPDYEIIAVDSPVLDWLGSGVTKQVETIDSLGMKFRFYSVAGGAISKLRVTGNPIVKGDLYKVSRENVVNTEKREAIECKWIYTQADAERLAIIKANWHDKSRYRYTFPACTLLTIAPGDYVTLSESSVMGASQTLRVVSVEDGADPVTIKLVCEGVSAYTYTALTQAVSSGAPEPVALPPSVQSYAQNAAPSNNATDLQISYEQNADGSIDVILSWNYLQGAVPADGFLVYFKSDQSAPVPINPNTDPSVFVPWPNNP